MKINKINKNIIDKSKETKKKILNDLLFLESSLVYFFSEARCVNEIIKCNKCNKYSYTKSDFMKIKYHKVCNCCTSEYFTYGCSYYHKIMNKQNINPNKKLSSSNIVFDKLRNLEENLIGFNFDFLNSKKYCKSCKKYYWLDYHQTSDICTACANKKKYLEIKRIKSDD